MGNQEVEMSDVIVVLDELDDDQTQVVVNALKALGMCIESVDNENSVVEGSVATARLGEIKKVQFVRYVRNVFNYEAEQAVDGQGGTADAERDQYED
jgi:hypothetical protein